METEAVTQTEVVTGTEVEEHESIVVLQIMQHSTVPIHQITATYTGHVIIRLRNVTEKRLVTEILQSWLTGWVAQTLSVNQQQRNDGGRLH